MGSGELLYVPRLKAPHARSATIALASALGLEVVIAAPLPFPPALERAAPQPANSTSEEAALDRRLRQAQARAKALRAELEHAGARVATTSILRFGGLPELLASLLDEREPELVLVEASPTTLHDDARLRPRLGGSRAPVWVLTGDPQKRPTPIRCVLLPSDPLERAPLDVAAILARALELGLDLLHVASPNVLDLDSLSDVPHVLRAVKDLDEAFRAPGVCVLGSAAPPSSRRRRARRGHTRLREAGA